MKIPKRLISGLFAPAVAIASVSAQNVTDGYSFLNIPTSSHVFGLGGNNIAIIDEDVTLADQNPALIGPELDMQVAVSYMLYMSSGNFASVRFGTGAGEHSGWALGLRYLNYGKFDGYDEFGTPTGSFTPSEVILEGTYSRDITDCLRGGATLKWIYSSYDIYTAMAVAVDLGINYYDPDRDLSLSAAVVNLGGQVKRFNERYERVPVDVRLGWTQSFPGLPIRFSITAWNLTRWHLPYYDAGNGTVAQQPEIKQSFASDLFRHLVFAADFIPSDRFNLGIGYNYKVRTDMAAYSRNLLSGFSIGAGFNASGWGVSVAFAQPHRSATTLMLNLSLSLSQIIN